MYAEVVAKAIELKDQGKTHKEICEVLNDLGLRTRRGKPWRHPQQIVKLLRSFYIIVKK
ncbi:recombinase family protein [Gimesia aquarii]|uniref:recombinase family protein n=1 Tax=Gimesia aquarii TaxID=2527964 RepID=UPI0036F19548